MGRCACVCVRISFALYIYALVFCGCDAHFAVATGEPLFMNRMLLE